MRKILTVAAAALTMAGGLAATTTPAMAQGRHGGFHGGGGGWHGGGGWRGGGGHWHGGGWGWGVGAGLAGFALGSALASPYYGYGYDYGPGYYGYGGCARQVWDPYWGRWVVRSYC